MKTLEEAIRYYEEQAKKCNNRVNEIILGAERCKQDKEEYTQLADWLRELQERRELSEQRWIPCSERLPEEEIEVLVTRKFLGCKDVSHGWNNHIPPSTYVEVAQYSCGEWEALSDEYKIARNRHTNPIAWMPLPEPYKP